MSINDRFLSTKKTNNMRSINIEPSLKEICPRLRLGCVQAEVVSEQYSEGLWEEVINPYLQAQESELETNQISQIMAIAEARAAYKALGKDPSRYRLSAEALLRRVVKGKGIYQINNIVDIINISSIKSGFSIGGYDTKKIEGDICLGVGKEGEPYEAIGRGTLNIHLLPTFRDARSAFGTPTSDSIRTMWTMESHSFMMVYVDFAGNEALSEAMAFSVALLEKYARATHVVQDVIAAV